MTLNKIRLNNCQLFFDVNNNSSAVKILSMPPIFAILTLPYYDLKKEDGEQVSKFEKKIIKGKKEYCLSILSGIDHETQKIKGIPYGSYARLLLYYICTEVCRTKSREIHLGSSYREIFNKLQIINKNKRPSGNQIKEFKEQLERLLLSEIMVKVSSVNKFKKVEETNFIKMFDKVKKVSFKSDAGITDNSYTLRITEDFFKLLVNKYTIFPYEIATEFKNKLMALDLAIFLNYWSYSSYRFRKNLFISFKELQYQFGSSSSKKSFNDNIKKSLIRVLKLIDTFHVKYTNINNEDGLLLLSTSRPMVFLKDKKALSILKEHEIIDLENEFKDNKSKVSSFIDIDDEVPY